MGTNPQNFRGPNISKKTCNFSTKFGTLNKHYKAYYMVKKPLQFVRKLTRYKWSSNFQILGAAQGCHNIQYAELANFFPICGHNDIYFAYPWRHGQADWVWVAWLNTEMDGTTASISVLTAPNIEQPCRCNQRRFSKLIPTAATVALAVTLRTASKLEKHSESADVRQAYRAMLTKISKWSRIQDSFQITPKIESLVVFAISDIPSKFQKDPSITFWVILLTHRQTNKLWQKHHRQNTPATNDEFDTKIWVRYSEGSLLINHNPIHNTNHIPNPHPKPNPNFKKIEPSHVVSYYLS